MTDQFVRLQRRTLAHNGYIGEREYFIAEAARYPVSRPIIVALHGWGQRVDRLGRKPRIDYLDFPAMSRLAELAAADLATVVFPVGKRRKWDHKTLVGGDDAIFIGQLLRRLRDNSPDSKIYLFGFSQGAAFSHIVLHNCASFLSGAVIHSGFVVGLADQARATILGPHAFTYATVRVPIRDLAAKTAESLPAKFPIVIAQGQKDKFYNLTLKMTGRDHAKEAADAYRAAGCNVRADWFPELGHSWHWQSNREWLKFMEGEG